MSVSDLKAYGKRIKADPEVRAAAVAIGLSHPQEHIEFARTLGYAFSNDDIAALMREGRPEGELTEEELASVSGTGWKGGSPKPGFSDSLPDSHW